MSNPDCAAARSTKESGEHRMCDHCAGLYPIEAIKRVTVEISRVVYKYGQEFIEDVPALRHLCPPCQEDTPHDPID